MIDIKKKRKFNVSRLLIVVLAVIVLIGAGFGIYWFFNQDKDADGPDIVFQKGDPITLEKVDGKLSYDALFTVTDASKFTIDLIAPALDTLENGEQELCVTASDEHKNTTKKCANLNIKIVTNAVASNSNYSSAEELITAFIKEYRLNTNSFGFFYYSPQDDETYVYNGDGVFNAASTIKVPLNMLYYDKIANGEVDSAAQFKLIEDDEEEGGGHTSEDYKPGQAIPLSYLQSECIVNSDNTATNVLVRNLGGFGPFRRMLTNFSDASLPQNFSSENVITPNYMLDVMVRLYNQQNQYTTLIKNMKNAAYGEYLQSSTDEYEIAQKYGLYDDSLHSIGIVYTEKPYLVGIYSNNIMNAENFIKELNAELIAYQVSK